MKRIFLSLFLCLFSATLPAQTLKIAHKSHGGKARTFKPSVLDHFGGVIPEKLKLWSSPTITTIAPMRVLPPEPLYPVPEFNTPIPELPAAKEVPCPEEKKPKKPESEKVKTRQSPARSTPLPSSGESADQRETQPIPAEPCPDDNTSDAPPPAGANHLGWLYGFIGLLVAPAIAAISLKRPGRPA